jgi:two-component system, OmpR family, alkaline phosphatase synthesis response regulator PhoP
MAEQVETLVVDDEAGIRFFITETLQRAGHVVTAASDGDEALTVLRDRQFDLVMLDLKLGGRVDGLKVLEAVRWRWPDTTVIILTAHGSLESAMTAIRDGVNRYLLKPLTPKELREAVNEALEERRELLQRSQEQAKEPTVLEHGPIRIELQKHQVLLDETPLDLTPSEFDLLVHLMRNGHRVVPPQELVEVVRGYHPDDLYEARSIIKWYVHRLRQSVEPDPPHPRFIINVRGVGYRFGD